MLPGIFIGCVFQRMVSNAWRVSAFKFYGDETLCTDFIYLYLGVVNWYLLVHDLPDICTPTFDDFQRDERSVTKVYLLAAWYIRAFLQSSFDDG